MTRASILPRAAGLAVTVMCGIGLLAFNALGAGTAALGCYALGIMALTVATAWGANEQDLLDPAFAFFAIFLLLNAPGPLIHAARGHRAIAAAAVSLWSLIAFVMGAEMVRLIAGDKRFARLREAFQSKPATVPREPRAWLAAAALAATAGAVLGAAFFIRAGGSPMAGGEVETRRLAAAAGSGYLRQGMLALLPTAALALGLAGLLSGSRRAVLGAAALSLLAVMLIVASGYLHPAVQLAVAWIALAPAVTARSIGMKRVAAALLLLFVIGCAWTWARQAAWPPRLGESLTSIAASIAAQSQVSTEHLARIVAAFPQRIGFLGGRGYLMDLGTLLPGPQVSFSHWLAARLHLARPEWADMSIMGEFYANFGWGGIAAGMLALGAAARALYIAFLRRNKTLPRLLLLLIVSFTIGRASRGGIGANVVGYFVPNVIALTLIVGLAAVISRRTAQHADATAGDCATCTRVSPDR
jgi:hypothetical protein